LRLPRRRFRHRGAGGGLVADLLGLAAATWLAAGLTGIPASSRRPVDISRSVAAEPDADPGEAEALTGEMIDT